MVEACKRLKNNKATGCDNIPAEEIKLAVKLDADILLQPVNKMSEHSIFPLKWKKANLMLFQKPGKDAREPSAYIPISLLNSVGKLYEQQIAERLKMNSRKMDLCRNASLAFGKEDRRWMQLIR